MDKGVERRSKGLREHERMNKMGPDTEQPDYEKQDVAQSRAEGANLTDVLGRMRARADNSYCRYIDLCRTEACLGWEAKIEKGLFGERELKAHKAASEEFGRHRALDEAIKMIEQDLRPNDKIKAGA